MSIIDTMRRGTGTHRLSAAELREENRLLLAREVAASDFFNLLIRDRDDVYAAWEQSQQQAADAELVVVCQQDAIEKLAAEVTRLRAQLANLSAIDVPPMERDTSDGADQATGPIDVQTLWQAHGIGPAIRSATV